ncbi:MAG: hypothetical protein NVSMB5_05690 [Candidatus Velthaea sp.]
MSDGGATATLTDIGAHAAGNIGVNIAAGAFNNQANATLISSRLDSGSVSAVSNQSLKGLSSILTTGSTASVGGSAFTGAAGNIGVNVAAGVANQQNNMLFLQP